MPAPSRKRIEDGRQSFRIFPQGFGVFGTTWLYAVGLPDGVVKLGVSVQPRGRAMQYWLNYAGKVAWFHVGPRFHDGSEARRAESAACLLAVAQGAERLPRHKEFFVGLTREQAISCLRMAVPKPLPEVRSYQRRPSRIA